MSKFLIKEIEKMDVTTEEFFELYTLVRTMYWQTPPPVEDDFYKSCKVLDALIHSDQSAMVITTAKILLEVFNIVEGKREAVQAELQVGNHKLFFRLATSKDATDSLHKMLSNIVVMKAKEGQPDEPSCALCHSPYGLSGLCQICYNERNGVEDER